MKALTLPGGAIFQSFWGGSPYPAKTFPGGKSVGDHSTVRTYHDLSTLKMAGMDWVKVYWSDPDFPHERYSHCEYLSTDGQLKIARYFDDRDVPYYHVYEASTWRENMKSTFGNFLPQIRDRRFHTPKEAAQAAINSQP